ncbi:hypothetical protein EYF80_022824 [Liparis tanakae]|uniref:Uncharacterized protein n=1 Tax=Liparis tanakae TaxID=230148 RepID=A0A4Z2HMD2_9TELE|nr:hypothetical protein EYF80_022824 [Liparis tanakae]
MTPLPGYYSDAAFHRRPPPPGDGLAPRRRHLGVLRAAVQVGLQPREYLINALLERRPDAPESADEKKPFQIAGGVAHPGVGLGRRGEHLDEDVQVFVQVLVLGFGALPQLFFLTGGKKTKYV